MNSWVGSVRVSIKILHDIVPHLYNKKKKSKRMHSIEVYQTTADPVAFIRHVQNKIWEAFSHMDHFQATSRGVNISETIHIF